MSTTLDSYAIPPDSLLARARKIIFEHDSSIADQLRIAEEDIDATDICLDFANVQAVKSAELSALIRFSLRMRQLDRSVHMYHVGAHVAETFEITRFRDWKTH